METKTTKATRAPCGSWASPITAELVASAGISLSAPSIEDGVVRWLEGRPSESGRVVLVELREGGLPEDVTPDEFNVRSMVHEYGGGAYCVHRGTVVFSNFADQRLYRLDPGEAPVPITPPVEERRHRYADGRVTPDGLLWIGVRERHEGTLPSDVVNELVALPTDGSAEPRLIAGGRDFYSAPRISKDGRWLCFLAWNLPWMPWDGCELFVAELAPDGTPGELVHVAGRDGDEAIWQPQWSQSGDLAFASDRSGWWNLEWVRDSERAVLHAAEAEFGYPAWALGQRSYAFLDDGRIACCYDRAGRTHFALLDPESGDLEDMELPHDALRGGPNVAAEGSTVVLVAASATIPSQLVCVDASSGTTEVLRTSAELPTDRSFFSRPRPIEFPTEDGRTAHALYYRPTNPDFVAEEGERPPLIVNVHGGPTANASPGFSLGTQFWTSRGFAVVDVDYGGSTGYGRAYRKRLDGKWGVVDLADCVNAARYLVDGGEADPERLLIRGSSAGGYTTICALTFTDVFAAGASYYGLADLERFATGETHKFESKYEHILVGPYPEAADLYRARSPIHFVDQITTPMLVLQGADDEIVPPAQAEIIVAALRERGIPHGYLLFEGEGHGFRKAENIARAFDVELSFHAQVLGFEPADPVAILPIERT